MTVAVMTFRLRAPWVHPDMTRITMTLEGIYPEYSDTLRRSSEDME